jgi:hypothetical protein
VITSHAQANDLVITESDSIVDQYLPEEVFIARFHPDEIQEIEIYLENNPHAGIWQAVMGRDRTRNDISSELRQWLDSKSALQSQQGFAEQDATYRSIKTRSIGREAYQYRLTLYEYQGKWIIES